MSVQPQPQVRLLLHLAAVSAVLWITPGDNIPRFKNSRKCPLSCLDAVDVPQLILYLAAVSAAICTTPGHSSPRFKNGSKSKASCLDVLNASQLLLHLPAVSAVFRLAPGYNCSRFKNGSKSTISSRLDVLHVPQLLLYLAAVSAALWVAPVYPQIQEWQQKHSHLLRCAARFEAALAFWLLSLTKCAKPQVTTAPESRITANAPSVAWMLWTFLS